MIVLLCYIVIVLQNVYVQILSKVSERKKKSIHVTHLCILSPHISFSSHLLSDAGYHGTAVHGIRAFKAKKQQNSSMKMRGVADKGLPVGKRCNAVGFSLSECVKERKSGQREQRVRAGAEERSELL